MDIVPIEAKGGEDKSAPSFKKYISDHAPEYALRYSKRGYRKDGYITNMPLYLVLELFKRGKKTGIKRS